MLRIYPIMFEEKSGINLNIEYAVIDNRINCTGEDVRITGLLDVLKMITLKNIIITGHITAVHTLGGIASIVHRHLDDTKVTNLVSYVILNATNCSLLGFDGWDTSPLFTNVIDMSASRICSKFVLHQDDTTLPGVFVLEGAGKDGG